MNWLVTDGLFILVNVTCGASSQLKLMEIGRINGPTLYRFLLLFGTNSIL